MTVFAWYLYEYVIFGGRGIRGGFSINAAGLMSSIDWFSAFMVSINGYGGNADVLIFYFKYGKMRQTLGVDFLLLL